MSADSAALLGASGHYQSLEAFQSQLPEVGITQISFIASSSNYEPLRNRIQRRGIADPAQVTIEHRKHQPHHHQFEGE
jgi:hypothetical protein